MPPLRVRYQTIEFENMDIHVRTLRDNQQYCDADGAAEKLGISSATWPFFGLIWDSSLVLAHFMCDFNISGKRILEVGCGIGLSSLLLNSRLADITATDYHPEAGNFLMENTKLNHAKIIPFIRTGWENENVNLGRFDLIIGSDLLYERNHPAILSGFIDQHVKPACEVLHGKRTYAIVGDGSFQYNIQDLQTIRHHNLPITIIVFNNDGYGAIKITQNMVFKREFGTSSKSDLTFCDIEKISKRNK